MRCADITESEKDVFVTEVSEDFADKIKAAKEKPSKDKTEKEEKLAKADVETVSDTKIAKEKSK